MQVKIWNDSEWIPGTKPETIKTFFTDLLKRCGFNVLNISEHRFQPDGYTGLWLLSESHFAVHTFPEIDKTYIELSSCNLEFFKQFIDEIKTL